MSNNDLIILRGLLSRENFDSFADLIQTLPTLEYETKAILKAISDYYETYPDATGLSPDELRVWFWARNKTIRGRETFEILLAEIKSLAIENKDLIKQQLIQTAERHLATSFSQELLKIIDGTSQHKLADLLQQFNTTFAERIGAVETCDDELSCLVRAPDTVQELLAATKVEGPLWPIKFLNETIGPIGGGSLGHIFASPECYSDDTEILTNHGWVLFKNLDNTMKVAQYNNNGEIQFVFPEKIIAHPYQGSMYHIHDTIGRVDLLVTPGHRMIFSTNKTNTLKEQLAKDIKYNQCKNHIISGVKSTGKTVLTPYERFLIAYQADGSGPRSGCTGERGHLTVRFSLKKQRKIKRLRWILKEAELAYTESRCNHRDGFVRFYVQIPGTQPPSKTFDWVSFEDISYGWCRDFLHEVSCWDGTRRSSTYIQYVSTEKQNIDIVQAIAAMCASGSNYGFQQDHRRASYKDTHRLSIRTGARFANGQSLKKDMLMYNGMVYCVTVPSGMVIVRRNNSVSVCGNCGKTSFAAACAAYCAYQYRNDPQPILYMGNEEKIELQKLRCTISLIGKPHEWILAHPDEANKLFAAKGGGNLIFYGELPTVRLVEVAVEKHKPAIVFLDQSVKLNLGRGAGDLARHERLAAIYNRLRTLATHTGTRIVGVGQADNDASNKRWLGLNNMDGSKVGLPGELDYAIGIGKVDDPARAGVRYFNVCKNKLRGIQDRATVQFDNQLVRWTG